MLVVSKFNKCETRKQKITTLLTDKRHVLISSYFYKYVSHLLSFNINNIVLFNTRYVLPNTLKWNIFMFVTLLDIHSAPVPIYDVCC